MSMLGVLRLGPLTKKSLLQPGFAAQAIHTHAQDFHALSHLITRTTQLAVIVLMTNDCMP